MHIFSFLYLKILFSVFHYGVWKLLPSSPFSNPNTSSSPEFGEPPKLWKPAGPVRGGGQNEGEVSEELTLGLKVKQPKTSATKIIF